MDINLDKKTFRIDHNWGQVSLNPKLRQVEKRCDSDRYSIYILSPQDKANQNMNMC